MAIAGRVAIVPKGEWSQSVTYDKLDLVTHNGNAFIAYKSSLGVEPVDGDTWMLIMESISTDDVNKLKEDVESILNGTTPVGDSDKLGGKGASEYNLGNLIISEKSLDTLGPDYSIPNVWTYIGLITPTEKFSDSGWLMGGGRFTIIGVYYDNYTNGVQTIIGGLGIKQRNINAGTWGEWKLIGTDLANYLPTTGGEIAKASANPLYVHRTNGTNIWTGYKGNGAVLGFLGFSGADNPVYTSADGTKINPLLHTGNSSKVVQTTSAPSNTTAVWVDTANKKVKAYIDGAWTAMA